MWRRSGIKLRRRGAYRRHDALPLEGLERLSPGCGKPLAVVTVSRSARRGLHAADGGTSSHFLPIVPAVKLVNAKGCEYRKNAPRPARN